MNIFSPHIPFAELADIAEHHAVTSPEAFEHLSTCFQCSNQLETIKRTLGLMRSDTDENAPTEVVEQAKNIFRKRKVPQEAALVRLAAVLTFDSLTATPAFGLRSQTTAGRQLIYSTDRLDLEVRVAQDNDEWQISGQILGPPCPDAKVGLEGENLSASTKVNELCEFSFDSVSAGAYKISLRLPDLFIETPQLELGP